VSHVAVRNPPTRRQPAACFNALFSFTRTIAGDPMGEWEGEVDLAPSWGLYVGTGGTTQLHAHLAHKLVVGLDGTTEIVGVEPLAPNAWLVRGGQEHIVRARGRVLLVFFDAGSFGSMTAAEVDAMRKAVPALERAAPQERVAIVENLAARLPRVPDVRVSRATSMLRDESGLDITELAARLGISATRLTHLFADDLGFAPRRYRTWGTLRRALALMVQAERSLTEIAHEAGFADSSHMSRAFAAMLGVPPSAIANASVVRLRDG
jgi:AraC-like DNA-binding protein